MSSMRCAVFGFVCALLLAACGSASNQAEPSPTFSPTQTQPPPTAVVTAPFETTIGGPYMDRGVFVRQTGDGGYIITGYTTGTGLNDENVYLVKTDAAGQEEWSNTFGGDYVDNGWSVVEASDGGYVVAGFSDSFGGGDMDIYLIRTDDSGDEIWSKTFGGDGDEYGWALQATSDGGYVIAGQTDGEGAGREDFLLLKVTAGGEEEWSRTFGGEDTDRSFSVQQTADGGFILAGTTESFGAGHRDAHVVKTDAMGNEEWTRTFGGAGDDVAHAVEIGADGSYLVLGYTGSFGAQVYDVYLTNLDESGEELWTTTFGGSGDDRVISGQGASDGGYILAGYTTSLGAGNWDAYLVKVDQSGSVEWERVFGGIAEDTGYTVRQTADGGFVLTGQTFSFGNGASDVYLIKTDVEGHTTE